jgi:hypothetical protein
VNEPSKIMLGSLRGNGVLALSSWLLAADVVSDALYLEKRGRIFRC